MLVNLQRRIANAVYNVFHSASLQHATISTKCGDRATLPQANFESCQRCKSMKTSKKEKKVPNEGNLQCKVVRLTAALTALRHKTTVCSDSKQL